VTIYTKGNQFDDVKGAYARLVDSNTKKEFCKFNLSRNLDNISNGAIVASISRVGNPSQGQWSIKARGYYTKNTWSCPDMNLIIQKLLKNDYSGVKILKDGDNGAPRGGSRGSGNNEGCCNIF
jgi:hypothetical protein